jgi:hypothetical protein
MYNYLSIYLSIYLLLFIDLLLFIYLVVYLYIYYILEAQSQVSKQSEAAICKPGVPAHMSSRQSVGLLVCSKSKFPMVLSRPFTVTYCYYSKSRDHLCIQSSFLCPRHRPQLSLGSLSTKLTKPPIATDPSNVEIILCDLAICIGIGSRNHLLQGLHR